MKFAAESAKKRENEEFSRKNCRLHRLRSAEKENLADAGGRCAYTGMDLGIVIGSAVSVSGKSPVFDRA